MYENEILSINELHNYIASESLTLPEDIKKLTKLTSKLPNSMETSWNSSRCLQI